MKNGFMPGRGTLDAIFIVIGKLGQEKFLGGKIFLFR